MGEPTNQNSIFLAANKKWTFSFDYLLLSTLSLGGASSRLFAHSFLSLPSSVTTQNHHMSHIRIFTTTIITSNLRKQAIKKPPNIKPSSTSLTIWTGKACSLPIYIMYLIWSPIPHLHEFSFTHLIFWCREQHYFVACRKEEHDFDLHHTLPCTLYYRHLD